MATGDISPDMADQIAAMCDAPVMRDGWDVALHLSQAAVQTLVLANWTGPVGTGTARTVNWIAPAQEDGSSVVIDLQTELTAPRIGLDPGTQSARIAFDIDSGIIRIGKAASDQISLQGDVRKLAPDSTVAWERSVDITPEAPVYLSGQVPLSVQSTEQAGGFAVSLDFGLTELSLTGGQDSDLTSAFGPQELLPWLAAQGLTDQIATVAQSDPLVIHTLSPAKVTARIVTDAGGTAVLQLLTASNPQAGEYDLAISAPPNDAYDFSLVVSSQAAVTMIANSYNAGSGDIKLNIEAPQDGLPHAFAQVREPMVFEGAFGIDGGETFHTDHSELYMRFGGSADEGVKLFTFIDPNSTVALQLDLAAHYPLGISGAGADQLVGLRPGAQSVKGDGFYEQLVVPQLTYFLTGEIQTEMTAVAFAPLSQLTLADLQLSGHDLAFQMAAFPGELVVMGQLDKRAG
jgi:hypothetical protein